MEPRPFRRGNGLLGPVHPVTAEALQWSHVLSDVETRRPSTRHAPRTAMLQWSHVLSDVETCPNADRRPDRSVGVELASMEPRPFRRGNDHPRQRAARAVWCSFNGATSFQTWKRAWIFTP